MKQVPLLIVLSLACGGQAGAGTAMLAPADGSPFDVGGGSGRVLLADVNGDDHLDLLTEHPQARAIRVHLGDGKATFTTAKAVLRFRFTPAAMELGDVNGDRVPDLVVTAGARDLVDVLLGDARGGFRRAAGSPFAASKRLYQFNKRYLHLVDVNGDRRLDIVTANRRGQYAFQVLLGNGRGRFAAGPVLRVAPAHEGYTLAFGDIDGDGDVDAVTAMSSPVGGRVAVHLGDGRGAFGGPRSSVPLPPTYVIEALADVNGDRRPDLVLSHRDARVSVLLNRGRGRFAPAAGSPFAMAKRPFALALADLNRDDRIDLVGATTDSVSVLLGNGRAFPRARQSSFGAGPGAYAVAVGDLNEDGRPDVVASSFESSAVTVLLGR